MGRRKNFRIGKKASLQDLLFITVLLLFFSFVILIGYKLSNTINTEFQSSSLLPANAKTASNTLNAQYTEVIDNSFLFLAIGLGIGTLVLASLIRAHPIFIPLFIIALIFVIFISGIASNFYQEMAANPELAAEASGLLIVSTIMRLLPVIIGGLGTLVAIIMFKASASQ